MLFGDARASFAPIHAADFWRIAAEAILSPENGVEILEARGPETLDGVEIALRLARRYRALPIPVFVPALGFVGAFARLLGLSLFAPDQPARLTGGKSSGPLPPNASKLRHFPG